MRLFGAPRRRPYAPRARSRQASAPAQNQTAGQGETTPRHSPQGEQAAAAAPLYTEFRGVKIGTSRDEVRKKLGSPREKDDRQDFFQLSERERERVYLDEKGAASAVIVTYVGKSGDTPTPKAIRRSR